MFSIIIETSSHSQAIIHGPHFAAVSVLVNRKGMKQSIAVYWKKKLFGLISFPPKCIKL